MDNIRCFTHEHRHDDRYDTQLGKHANTSFSLSPLYFLALYAIIQYANPHINGNSNRNEFAYH